MTTKFNVAVLPAMGQTCAYTPDQHRPSCDCVDRKRSTRQSGINHAEIFADLFKVCDESELPEFTRACDQIAGNAEVSL